MAQGRAPEDTFRVLVVEDDPGIGGSLVRGLRRAGYEVHQVAFWCWATVMTPHVLARVWRLPRLVAPELGVPSGAGGRVADRGSDRVAGRGSDRMAGRG